MAGPPQLPAAQPFAVLSCCFVFLPFVCDGQPLGTVTASEGLRGAILGPDGEAYPVQTGSGSRQLHRVRGEASVDHLGRLTDLAPLRGPIRQSVNGSTPTGTIQIGTPPVTLSVIFDTGSDKLVAKTWDTVMRELKMVDRGVGDDVQPTRRIYNHNSSSTYIPQYSFVQGEKVPKRGYVSYGSGIALTDEGQDTVIVGGQALANFTVSEITADSLAVLHSSKGVAGVLGLQHMRNHSVGESVFTRLRDQGLLTAFGYCRASESGGTFIWGDTATDGAALDVLGQIHWAISMADVEVRGSTEGMEEQSQKANETPQSQPPGNGTAADRDRPATPVAVGLDQEYRQPDREANMDRGYGAAGGGQGGGGSGGAFPGGGRGATNSDPPRVQRPGGNPMGEGTLEQGVMCPGGKCVAIIDTGSNIIAGPKAALRVLMRKVGVKYDCSNLHELPPLEFSLAGYRVSLPGSAYVMKIKLPSWMPFRHVQPAGRRHSWLESNVSLEGLWSGVIQELHRNYGLDLRTDLDGVPLATLLSAKKLCMPAFVPLDKDTKMGPLWVVGTPLFDKYYVRWSWPQNDPVPRVFIKELDQADACRQGNRTPSVQEPSELLASGGLMRAESRPVGKARAARVERPTASRPGQPWEAEPQEREAEDIRYPHWAKELASL